MKNKKGFTLIELLAVIIILGILMIIAVPSVTKYISDSRKNGYVSTAKNIASGARNLVNSGSLDLNDEDTTYYIDGECIKTDTGYKSPYGEFDKAYIVVTANYNGHDYFWTSVDETGIGVKGIIKIENLDNGNIKEGVTTSDITTDRRLDNRKYIVVVDSNCQKGDPVESSGPRINGLTGEEIVNEEVCKKATTRHTATCTRSDIYGCNGEGQAGNGNTITYGTIPNGTPKRGDAYDCDVNNDGVYDATNERFYYVASEGTNSVLIYSKDMNNKTTYQYDTSWHNNYGPRDGYQYLPSTSEWSNPGIIAPGTRQIVAENGVAGTGTGELNVIDPFNYGDKAARLLTVQELLTACPGISSVGSYTTGELNACNWLLEGIGQYEGTSGTYGYWLETPRSTSLYRVWLVYGIERMVYSNDCDANDRFTIRPVITVKTSDIEQ